MNNVCIFSHDQVTYNNNSQILQFKVQLECVIWADTDIRIKVKTAAHSVIRINTRKIIGQTTRQRWLFCVTSAENTTSQ